jgi:hypothetical protein
VFQESCSSSYTGQNKIGFAIFGFFCDFIWILQIAGKTQRKGMNLFAQGPWKDLGAHSYALGLHKTPQE